MRLLGLLQGHVGTFTIGRYGRPTVSCWALLVDRWLLINVVVHVGFPNVRLWLVQSTKVAPRVYILLAKVVLGSRGQVAMGQISRGNNGALSTNRFLRTVVVILDVVVIVVLQGGFVVVEGARRPTVIIAAVTIVVPVVLFALATTALIVAVVVVVVIKLTLLVYVIVSFVAAWAAIGASPRKPSAAVVLLRWSSIGRRGGGGSGSKVGLGRQGHGTRDTVIGGRVFMIIAGVVGGMHVDGLLLAVSTAAFLGRGSGRRSPLAALVEQNPDKGYQGHSTACDTANGTWSKTSRGLFRGG